MNATLESITNEMASLATALDESETGELTPELSAALDALNLAEEEKVIGYVRLIRALECRAAAKRAERDQHKAHLAALSAGADAADSKVALLKARLLNHLERTGQKSREAGPYTIRWQSNGRPSVLDCPPANELPDIFQRVKIEADKDALGKAFTRGEALPAGVIVEVGKSLRINGA